MNEIDKFFLEVQDNIENLKQDEKLQKLSKDWCVQAAKHKYTYNFTWMGRPIIQLPQDLIAMQEIIWEVKPDLIVETGIAHGGSLIFYASMLELLGQDGEVLGIDIDIREHNRREIENHPMFKRISMFEGSSLDPEIIQKVKDFAKNKQTVLVALDSNHTYDHVKQELELYSPLVTKGSNLVVFDTVIQDLPEELYNDRPWNQKNNPKMAVHEFLQKNDRFIVDKERENKLLITVAPDGYLKCIKD
jgi:cephalosporin hydroxylase